MDFDSEIVDLLSLEPEEDDGNVEYKRQLTNLSPEDLERKSTQMQFRMKEGDGECFYCIGINDDGTPFGQTSEENEMSIEKLKKIAEMNDYTLRVIDTRQFGEKTISRVHIRENNITKYRELRLGVAGRVDAGKSTLVGTLVTGENDNGRGRTRAYSFNFKHELESGRTSSVSQQIIGYDLMGKHIPMTNDLRTLSWTELTRESSRVVTLFDFAGHAKYSGTTYVGMSSNHIDYVLIAVGANMGITKGDMTIEHIRMATAYRIPIIFVLTKIDIVAERPDVMKESIDSVHNLFGKKVKKKLLTIKSISDVMTCVEQNNTGQFVPLFLVSCVTGEGLDLIHQFLNLCPPRHTFNPDGTVEMEVSETYMVTGVGTVIGGFLSKGTIKVNSSYFLGPNKKGDFIPVRVRTIEEKRKRVSEVTAGKFVCLGCPKVNRNCIKRGMIICQNEPKAVKKFTAQIIVHNHHATTVKVGYSPLLVIHGYRSAVQIVSLDISEEVNIRQSNGVAPRGKSIIAKFKIVHRPCFLREKDRIVLVENTLRIVGVVTSIGE